MLCVAYSNSVKAWMLLLLLTSTGCSGCSSESDPKATGASEQATSAGESSANPEDSEDSSVAESDDNTDLDNPSSATREANPSHQAPQATVAKTGNSSASGILAATKAQQQARASLKNARDLANQGDTTEAFQELLTAWQGLQQYPDASSQTLADELKQVLKGYGESINALAAKNEKTPVSRKPLTVE